MMVNLDENESLLLSALLCVGTISSSIPEVFDGIQLSPRIQKSPHTGVKYAEACLVLLENQKGVEALITKLQKAFEEPECGACTGPDPLDELDRRCAIAAREYAPETSDPPEDCRDSHCRKKQKD